MSERIYVKENLMETIRQKYASVSKIGADNSIVHKIFDFWDEEEVTALIEDKGIVFNPNIQLLQEEFDFNAKFKYNEAINEPLIYDYLASEGLKEVAKHAKLDWAINELPYASKVLKEKFTKMKNNQWDFISIGYGGAMSNVLWNMFIRSNTFEIFSAFNNIAIYEKDELSFSNLLRFGKPVIHRAFSKYQLDGDTVQKPLLISQEYRMANDNFEIFSKFLKEDDVKKIKDNYENPIIIGAPNFEARELLQKHDVPFLFVGHGDNEVTITYKPDIHFAVQETYGTIDIPVLIVNLWMATYKLVDILSQDPSNILNLQNNTELFQFNFDAINDKDIKTNKEKFKKIII